MGYLGNDPPCDVVVSAMTQHIDKNHETSQEDTMTDSTPVSDEEYAQYTRQRNKIVAISYTLLGLAALIGVAGLILPLPVSIEYVQNNNGNFEGLFSAHGGVFALAALMYVACPVLAYTSVQHSKKLRDL